MKALSLRQPWAWLIATGIKDVENRTWRTTFRGRFYIHAGKSSEIKVQGLGDDWIIRRLTMNQAFQYREARLDRGAIIGEVDVTDCKFRFGEENDNLYSQWAEPGLYGFTLANPTLYETPIPCRGALGFFNPPIEQCDRCYKVGITKFGPNGSKLRLCPLCRADWYSYAEARFFTVTKSTADFLKVYKDFLATER